MSIINEKRFIVVEGPDGSGKATQTDLIISYLKEKGVKVKKIDFPQYGKKSAGLVEEYLNGKYGSAKEVGPYRASIFYACDRYDASFEIKQWIEEEYLVVSDRYISSNVAHQGGKIAGKEERKKYLKWLYHLEYEIFEIPKPDFTIILKTSAEISHRLSSEIKNEEKKRKKELYLKGKKRDIHEEDKEHLQDSLNVYLEMAEEYPEDFVVVECVEEGRLLTPEEVHKKIIKQLSL